MDASGMNGLDEENTRQEHDRKRMDKYRISDEEWKKIEERLDSNNKPDHSSSDGNKFKSTCDSRNSNLSKYKISGEHWDLVGKLSTFNENDPGLPPTTKRQDKRSPWKNQKDTTYTSLKVSKNSADNGYAKLDHMRSRRPSHDNPEYEKAKKSPFPQRKQDSSLQQKIQQRKELSQSLQSLDALQDLPPLTIPKDGNIQGFSVEDMSTFFRYMRVDDSVVQRLSRKNLDGLKFSKLKDTDLENIGIKNPIIVHFRDRSCKKRIPFIL